MTWRSSAIAARPPASTASSASRAWSGVGVHDLAGGAGLDHHHADVVGHHVVQFAGDPGAFVLGRPAQRLGLLALQRGQPRPALVGAAFPPAQPVGRDGDRDQDQERRRRRPARSGTADSRSCGVEERRHRQAGQRRHPVRAVDRGGVGGDDAGVEGQPQRGVVVAHQRCRGQHDPQHRERVPAAEHQRQPPPAGAARPSSRSDPARSAGTAATPDVGRSRGGHPGGSPRRDRATGVRRPSPPARIAARARPSASNASNTWPRRDSGGSGPAGRSSSRDPGPQPVGHRHAPSPAILAAGPAGGIRLRDQPGYIARLHRRDDAGPAHPDAVPKMPPAADASGSGRAPSVDAARHDEPEGDRP